MTVGLANVGSSVVAVILVPAYQIPERYILRYLLHVLVLSYLLWMYASSYAHCIHKLLFVWRDLTIATKTLGKKQRTLRKSKEGSRSSRSDKRFNESFIPFPVVHRKWKQMQTSKNMITDLSACQDRELAPEDQGRKAFERYT
jgi:hypothetical protein